MKAFAGKSPWVLLKRAGILAVVLIAASLRLRATTEMPPPIGGLMIERTGHTATRLPDGKVLFVGGKNAAGTVRDSEVFNPSTRAFTVTAGLLQARADHTATLLPDGRLLVIGGRASDESLNSTEVYDPATNVFAAGPMLARARAGHTATLLPDNRIVVVGGDADGSIEILDPQAGTFGVIEARLSAPRSLHAAAFLKSGEILIAGGVGANGTVLNSTELFDTATLTFLEAAPSMFVARTRPTLRVLPDGKVQAIGGDKDSTMEVFNPDSWQFSSLVHPAANPNLLAAALKTQTRAAALGRPLPQKLRGVFSAEAVTGTDELLDRTGYSLTEIPELHQALVAGGTASSGKLKTSAALFSSSTATVTTDKTDYVPGDTIIITGTGWMPGETVSLNIHRDTNDPPDTVLNAVADANGNFQNTDYVVQEFDLGIAFLLTAAGQTSGYTAQTSFTDSPAVDGQGTMTIAPANVGPGSTNSFLLTFNAGTPGDFNDNSTVTVQIPAGWTAPQKTSSGSAGFVQVASSPASTCAANKPAAGTGNITISGQSVTVTAMTCNHNLGFTLEYDNAIAPATPGSYTFTTLTDDAPLNGTTFGTAIASSPVVTVFGPPTKLAFIQQPSTVPQYTAITPAVSVEVEDANGNRVLTSSASITIAIGTNPGSSTLGGTLTVAAVNGLATFGDLDLSAVGSHTLTAASTPLTGATSSAFNVTLVANTWTGAVSTNWNVAGNWSNSPPSIPANNATALIPGGLTNYPNITTGATPVTIGSIQINSARSGASVTVSTGGSLTVSGAGGITINGGGALNVTGGTATVTGPIAVNAAGTMSLSGGTINSAALTVDNGGAVTVSGGQMSFTSALNVNGTFTQSGGTILGSGTLALSTTANASTFNQSGGTLHMASAIGTNPTDAIAINAGGTFNQSATGVVDVKDFTTDVAAGALAAGTFNQSGGGLFHLFHDFKSSGTFNSTGGTVQFSGAGGGATWPASTGPTQFFNVLIDTADPAIDTTGGFGFSVKGNWTANVATALNGKPTTVTFNGSAAQAIGGSATTTFNNLILNNSAGATLGTNETVAGALTFTSGNITTGTNALTSGINATTGTVSASQGTGWIIGNEKKFVGNDSLSRTFDVGTSSFYTPITINPVGNISGTSGTSALQAKVTGGEQAQISTSGINSARDVNSFWTVTPVGDTTYTIPSTGYTLTAGFQGGDTDPGVDTNAFIVKRFVSPAWNSTTSPARTPTSTSATVTFGANTAATSAFGDFVVGEPGNSATSTGVTSSVNPSVFGQSVTLTATVTDTSGGDPVTEGTVTFREGGSDCSTGTIAQAAATVNGSGQVTYTTSALSVAAHAFRACYSDSTDFLPSNGTLTQTVNQASTTTTVASNNNPSTYGQSVTFTATVAPVAPGAGTPTGTVTFKDGASTLGTGALNGSAQATFSTSALTAGSHSITAVYGADTIFLGSTSSALTQTVGQKTVGPSISANSKIYDGTTAATISLRQLSGVVGADDVTLTGGTATFADKNVGSPKTVTATGLSLSGATAPNYVLSSTSATTAANITPRSLTVTAAGISKVYDGTATATVTLSDNRVAGDVLTFSYSASFANKNVGTGKTVSVSAISITGGADAGNYSLSNTTASTTADITARALTVTATGVTKVYDGNATATVTLSDDRVAGDVFTDTYTSATFATKTVGTAKPVSVSGVSISGADAGNYTFNTTASTTANITARPLVISATGVNKVYDGSTTASVVLTDNRVSGDVFTDSYAGASFATKNVGTGIAVNVTGISISGTDAGNYSFNTTASTTANITPKLLTAGIAASDKVYDGSAAATITGCTLTDVVGTDNVTCTTANGHFSDASVGADKTVTADVSLSGTDAGNYSVASTATTTASITKANLTVTGITAADKVYDRTTTAGLNVAGATLVGVVSGDDVTLNVGSAIGTFADKNVGVNKTVSISGLTISGAQASDYMLTQPSTTASITPLYLTVSGITASNRIYDSTTSATIDTSSAALNGVITGDTVTLDKSAAAGLFLTKTVGTSKTVQISGLTIGGADVGNYGLTQPTTTADITARNLTVSGVTANNKIYDGGTVASLNVGSASLVGVQGTDTVTLNTGSAVGAFGDKTVATGKTVTVSGLTISGTDSGNYTLTQPTTTADITPKALTGSITASNKVYDGTTTATIATRTLSGVIAPDVVSYVGGTATFADKNVGTGKTVSATGLSLSGADAGNYTVNSTASTTADITSRTLVVSATGVNKVYDGTTTATVTLSDDRVSGDVFTTSYTSASFASKAVGTGKTVSVSGISISGTDAGNYTANTTASTTADITGRPLTISATGVNKVYDGTTTATVGLTDNRVSGDVFTDSYVSASFATKNVGTGIAVSVTGISISGADAGNYTFNTTAATTADITKKLVTATVAASNKVYDGTTAATMTGCTLTGVVAADASNVSCTASNGQFSDASAGLGKTVTADVALSGSESGNYSVASTATTTADITKAELTVTGITAADKVYDRTTSATINVSGAVLHGVVSGDSVTLNTGSAIGTFDTKEVGTGKTVQISGLTISGDQAADYTLTQPTTTASITPLYLTVSGITASNKIYDATTAATIDTTSAALNGVIAPDVVTLDKTSATGAFANKNVGTSKTVQISGLTIGGADVGNYGLTQPTTTADITPKTLTANYTADDKVYDGTMSATVHGGTLTGVVSGDTVSLTGTPSGTFADKNAGAGKTVTVTGVSLTGGDAGNYHLYMPITTTASITQRTLTVTATGVSRTYDGTTSATVTLSDDRVSGDVFTDSYTTAAFTDKNVGTGKTINVSGISISGTDAGNYTFNATATATANITARSLTVTATGINKTYDGTTTATVTLSDNRVAGDAVTDNSTSATFSDKNVGTGKTVSVSGISISGADAGNYALSNTTASTTADITARALTISATGVNKVYDGNATATVTLSDNRVSGDSFTDSYTSATFADKNVGTGKAVSVSGISISGTDAGNYTFNTTAATTANITARALTVSATGINKVYDGTTAATVNLSDNRVSGDSFTDSYASAAFADANVGTAKPVSVSGISISGTDAGNYTFNTTAATTADITPASTTTTVTSSVNPSVYGQSVSFTATVASAGGTPSGSVQFTIDGVSFGSPVSLVAGNASSGSTTSLSVGPHSITADYSGSTNFSMSTSSTLTQTVKKASTSTVLTSNNNPSNYPQAVTLTATVTATAPGAGTPSGSVTFMDGLSNVAGCTNPATLNGSGVATCTTTALAVGSHSITAVYGSDANFYGSTSAVLTQVVKDVTPPDTTITSGPAEGSVQSSTSATFTFAGSDDVSAPANLTFQCSLDLAPFSACTSGTTYSGLSQGPHNFQVRASDEAGNTDPTPASRNWRVDTAPTANAQSVSTNEDTSKVITMGASDIDSPSLTFTVVTGPSHGTLGSYGSPTCAPSGSGSSCSETVTYSPAANSNGPDSFTFKVNDGTLDSNTATVSITVNPVNDKPTADAKSVTTAEDTPVAVTLSGSDVETPSGNLTYTVATPPAHGSLSGTAPNLTYTPASNYNGPDSFTYTVTDRGDPDNCGAPSATCAAALTSDPATVSIAVNSVNDGPAVNAPFSASPSTINENGSTTVSGSFTDPDSGDTHTVTIVWGDGSTNTALNLAAGVYSYSASHQYLDDNPSGTPSDIYQINVKVSDQTGASFSASTSITVNNVPPVITTVTGPSTGPIAKGGSTTVSATFTDVGTKDTHTCSVAWGDTTTTAGTVTETNGSGSCAATHTYAVAGVYTVTVTVTDDDTGTVSAPVPGYVVIYDASAGFVTGGGWITSPAGAMPANPTATGRANYGFNSKYVNGKTVPDGDTQFQFQTGNLNFHSTSYDWLVISGGYKAQYQGKGTINGTGNYSFILTAIDGTQQGSGGSDKFRIKIFDQNQGNQVIYDNNINQPDSNDPTTVPGGGNIVIHK